MRSGSGYFAGPSISRTGAGLRGDRAVAGGLSTSWRYVAATEWVLHITGVKTLPAKRLTRLNWNVRQAPRLGPRDYVKVKRESTPGFGAGGYFWRLRRAITLQVHGSIFQMREAGAILTASD